VPSNTLDQNRSEAARLGLELAGRIGAWQELMEQRIQALDGSQPVLPPEFRDREVQTRLVATMLIGRWLTSGVAASEEEAGWISEQGKLAAAAGFPVAAITKHFFCWRDTTIEFMEELAAELNTPPAFRRLARDVIRASADASLIRLVRDFDGELRRLREALELERSSLRRLALYDQLTGIPNRALFYDRLAQVLGSFRREQLPFSVMMLDLDRFKEINDTLGHHIGDFVLRHVAEQIRPVLRQIDTFARWGGDEFGFILSGASSQDAAFVGQRLQAALAVPFSSEGITLPVRASLGIASCPAHGADGDTLLRHADVALYAAKRAPDHIAVYDPTSEMPGAA
jgi:diguanylate cyclase (GGDEF)-like protein